MRNRNRATWRERRARGIRERVIFDILACTGLRIGGVAREPAAISGWSGGRMATLYSKNANRTRLAAGAIGKLDRGETENRTSIPAPLAEVRAGNRKSE